MLVTKENLLAKVDRGFALDSEIKGLGKELKEIKEGITDLRAAGDCEKKIVGGVGQVTVSETEVFDPIDIQKVYDVLVTRDLLGAFFNVVKVDNEALKRVLSDNDIAALRGPAVGTKYSLRFSAKK